MSHQGRCLCGAVTYQFDGDGAPIAAAMPAERLQMLGVFSQFAVDIAGSFDRNNSRRHRRAHIMRAWVRSTCPGDAPWRPRSASTRSTGL